MSEYDIKRNLLVIGGNRIDGYGTGDDAIDLDQPDPRVVQNVMCDGAVVASVMPSRQCTLTVKLRYNSASNKVIRNLADLGAPFTVRWVEPDGTTHFCQSARVSKVPKRTSGANTSDKTWEILGENVIEIEGPGVP